MTKPTPRALAPNTTRLLDGLPDALRRCLNGADSHDDRKGAVAAVMGEFAHSACREAAGAMNASLNDRQIAWIAEGYADALTESLGVAALAGEWAEAQGLDADTSKALMATAMDAHLQRAWADMASSLTSE